MVVVIVAASIICNAPVLGATKRIATALTSAPS